MGGLAERDPAPSDVEVFEERLKLNVAIHDFEWLSTAGVAQVSPFAKPCLIGVTALPSPCSKSNTLGEAQAFRTRTGLADIRTSLCARPGIPP